MFSLSMTFYLFPMAFRSWGSVERGPTYFTCLLKIPVHYHSDIYSPILPHEEGYGIQAFSRYLSLVQHNIIRVISCCRASFSMLDVLLDFVSFFEPIQPSI